MTDTVELIIKMPKGAYEQLIEAGEMDYLEIITAIENGTPLDDVKSEIDKAQEPYITNTAYDDGVRFGLMLAYQIVDKAESEEE